MRNKHFLLSVTLASFLLNLLFLHNYSNPNEQPDCFDHYRACTTNCATIYKKCSCLESGCEAQLHCCQSKCNQNEKCLDQCYQDYNHCLCKRNDCCNPAKWVEDCSLQHLCCQLKCDNRDFYCLEKCAKSAHECQDKQLSHYTQPESDYAKK